VLYIYASTHTVDGVERYFRLICSLYYWPFWFLFTQIAIQYWKLCFKN